jgi:hypothetical protein
VPLSAKGEAFLPPRSKGTAFLPPRSKGTEAEVDLHFDFLSEQQESSDLQQSLQS